MKTILVILFFMCAFSAKADTTICGRTYKDTTPITRSNQNNFTIRGYRIKNATGNAIQITNCNNVIIEDNIVDGCSNNGIVIIGSSTGCRVRFNLVMNTGGRGIYPIQTPNGGNSVEQNYLQNINSAAFVGAIQLNEAGPGNSVTGNYLFHDDALSDGGDIINLYQTAGTSGAHNTVANNYVEGTNGEPSSAGIQIDEDCHWVDVLDNVVNSPGGKGIAVNGSSDILVDGNKAFTICRDGITNVGYVTGPVSGFGCTNITLSNNLGYWFCGRSGICMGALQTCADNIETGSFFDTGGGCTAPTLISNDFSDDTLGSNVAPPSQAQTAYDYWFGCVSTSSGQGIILSPPTIK